MIIASLNCFLIPYMVGFVHNFYDKPGLVILSVFLELIFVTDIFINFRTTYLDSEGGEEVYDCK